MKGKISSQKLVKKVGNLTSKGKKKELKVKPKTRRIKPSNGEKKKIDQLIEKSPLLAKAFGIKIKLTGVFMIPVVLIIY